MRRHLFQCADFVLVPFFAGQYIVNDGGTFGAQSALAIFAKPNGELIRMKKKKFIMAVLFVKDLF